MTSENLPALPQDMAAFDHLTKADMSFVQRIALMQGLSKPVLKKKQWKGKGEPPSPGDLILGFGDDAVNFGSEVICIPGPFRPHALIIQSNAVETESFDVNDPMFKKIEKEANLKRKVEDRAVMVGVDVLFYLPQAEAFAAFFFCKTNRPNAKPCVQLRDRICVMVSYEEETKKYNWFKCRVEPADEAKTAGLQNLLPDPQALATAVTLFARGAGGGIDEDEDSEEADLDSVSRPR